MIEIADDINRSKGIRVVFIAVLIVLLKCNTAMSAEFSPKDQPINIREAIELESFQNLYYDFDLPAIGGDRGSRPSGIDFSPDGKSAIFLVVKSHIDTNSRIYSLRHVTLSGHERFGKPITKEIVRLSTKSQQPAISQVRWVSNNIIAFVGMTEGGESQIMSVNSQGDLAQHTNSPGRKIGFDMTLDGTLVFGVVNEDPLVNRTHKDPGYVIENQTLYQIMQIDGPVPSGFIEYFVARNSQEPTRIEGLRLRRSWSRPFVSLSPSGRYVVLENDLEVVPDNWRQLPLTKITPVGTNTIEIQSTLEIIDLEIGQRSSISGAPKGYFHGLKQLHWDESNARVFMIDQFISLDKAELLKGVVNPAQPVHLEFSLETMSPTHLIGGASVPTKLIDSTEQVRFTYFDPHKNILTLERGDAIENYHRDGAGWKKHTGKTLARFGRNKLFDLEIKTSLNEPSRLELTRNYQNKPLIIDSTVNSLRDNFNPVQLIEWVDANGVTWQAGLTLPKNRNPSERLPLIINSRGFSASSFAIQGWGSASIQPMASAGFAVLLMGFPKGEYGATPDTIKMQSEGYRSVVGYLDGLGLIDREKVGIIVFSESGYWLQHALTDQEALFSAAVATDANSFGQFMYLVRHNHGAGHRQKFITHNGSPPFGDGLDGWQKRDPVTMTGGFSIPIRMENYGNFPTWWEVYVAMREKGEPAEYYMLPDAPHNLIEPKHKYWTKSATLDWFLFWLKGELNENPLDAMQNERWLSLRKKRCAQESSKLPNYCSFPIKEHNTTSLDPTHSRGNVGSFP